MPTTLAIRLRTLRKRHQLTQQEVARRAGIRQATISDWEKGKVETMDFATLARVCAVYGVAVNDLLLLPHRTSKSATERWEAADDLAPPETAEEALEQFESRATDWRRLLTALAAKNRDAERGAGWGTPPARGKRKTPKQDRRDLNEAERSGAEAYVDLVLVQVTLARRAIKDGNASAAAFHALNAGNAHGAARQLITQFQRPRR